MLNWYLQSGNDSDVVLSTLNKSSKKYKRFSFCNQIYKKDALRIIEIVEEAVNSLGYGLKVIRLKDLDDITKLSLVEKHIISPEFAYNKNETGAIAINDDENICIMINEEDHIRIQVFFSRTRIKKCIKPRNGN